MPRASALRPAASEAPAVPAAQLRDALGQQLLQLGGADERVGDGVPVADRVRGDQPAVDAGAPSTCPVGTACESRSATGASSSACSHPAGRFLISPISLISVGSISSPSSVSDD